MAIPRIRPRFNEDKRRAIVKEGEKVGVKAALAKYHISEQSYRNWRYRVNGIKPKKRLSRTEKLQILEEGYQNGIKETCASHGVDSASYFRWKKKFGFLKSRPIPGPPRRFSKEQVLAIVKEAEKLGVKAASEKYGISASHYYSLRFEVTGVRLIRRFPLEEKLHILEEGYQNGVYQTCKAYHVDPWNYYYWKRALGFTKHRFRTNKQRRLIVDEAVKNGLAEAADKHHVYEGTIREWARRFKLEAPWRKRYNLREKRAIIKEATRNGILKTCRAYEIHPTTLRNWRRKLGTVEP